MRDLKFMNDEMNEYAKNQEKTFNINSRHGNQ